MKRRWFSIDLTCGKDWGPSALNTAQQAHFTASYQLPFGRGQHWLANAHGAEDKLVSGWVFNTVTTLLSGFPLTPLVGSNVSGDGDSRNPDRPNLNLSPTVPCAQQVNRWVNPCAYSLPLAGTYGNVSRGSLTGPGLVEMDVSMFKDTQITDKVKLQFRAECFNAAEPYQLQHTQPDDIFQRGNQPDGGADHQHGHLVPADSVRIEADLLTQCGRRHPAALTTARPCKKIFPVHRQDPAHGVSFCKL